MPLERYILENWSKLRSFEEFVLLFVNELKENGLEILRLSFAFVPEQDDIDCGQYVWKREQPGMVSSLRMGRELIETPEHRSSPLHFLATHQANSLRLDATSESQFPFLRELHTSGGCDYLGIRLDSRGISIPVLTICLVKGCRFSEEQVERIEAMSSMLSLLFHVFESERAKKLSLLDALTELPNRRHFDSHLKASVAAAFSAGSPLAIAIVDIDHFKLVNDSMGHAYGDQCLIQLAGVLRKMLKRENDLVSRLGGEEFGFIFSHTNAENAAGICERLRLAVTEANIHHPLSPHEQRCTISIGLAVWDAESSSGEDTDRLLQLADEALYAAKDQGRNRLVVLKHDPLACSSAATL